VVRWYLGSSAHLAYHSPVVATHAQLRRAPRLPRSGRAGPQLLVLAGNGGAATLAAPERPGHCRVAQESQHRVLAGRLQPALCGKDQESAVELPE